MVTTKLNLSMTEPQVRQIYAKQGDTGRVLDITLDQTPEDGTLRILRPDGVEVTSEAVTGGEVESGGTFESLAEADVTELSVGIEPVQDLNGYDHPWVGGAGKNLYNASAIGNLSGNGITATVSNGTITLNGTATANAFFSIYGTGYANQQYTYSFNNPVANSGVHMSFRDTNGNYFNDASANAVNRVITFTNEPSSILLYVTSGTTLSNFVVKPQLELGSTATAWQPYSNICPITGHDEVRVTRTGKNLARIRDVNATFSGITWQSDGASIRVKGTATSSSSPFVGAQVTNFDTMLNGVYPAGTYTVSCRGWGMSQTADRMTVQAKYADGTGVSGVDGMRITPSTVGGQPNGRTFTATKPFKVDFWCYIQSGSTVDFTATIQLELGSTATSYEPYQGSTYTTSLGQTVYGGTLDMVSGVLTVNRVKWIPAAVSVNSVTMTDGNAGYRFNNYLAFSGETLVDTSRLLDVTATFLKSGVSNWVTPNSITLGNDGKSFFACLSPSIGISTVSAFNSWITTNGYYIVYPLATPQTYQLTPQQIKTLVGINNVWASSGDIVNIKFTYGGLLSELPSDVTSVVGKCYCDIEQNGVSSMPFALNVKKNERQ